MRSPDEREGAMISDDERREVARRLRANADLCPNVLFDLHEAVGDATYTQGGLAKRLADLIEPQSVEPEAVTIYVGPDSREMDVWACPACGEVISYVFDDYNPKTDGPRYCSGCGRKVAKW
nr:MAG TPA: zinc-ribbon domain protein [Caudoviricetes sp.]